MQIGSPLNAWMQYDTYWPVVCCGARNCRIKVGVVSRIGDHEGTLRHVIDFEPGFCRQGDGVFSLSKRVERQWRHAQRAHIPWSEFQPRGRETRTVILRVPRVTEMRPPLRFRCPVCRRISLADIPEHVEPSADCDVCGPSERRTLSFLQERSKVGIDELIVGEIELTRAIDWRDLDVRKLLNSRKERERFRQRLRERYAILQAQRNSQLAE